MSAGDAAIWKFGDAELDEVSRELRIGGELVEIEPRPFDLLVLLLEHAGEVVGIEEIIATAWAGRLVNEASSMINVSNAIGKIRKVLKDDAREIIKTIPKVGYRFAAPAERVSRTRPPLVSTLELDGAVPGRPHWRLTEHLDSGGYGDVWVATNAKTHEQRVFKFCLDPVRLSALKRESTLFRMLRETLGDRAPVPALLEWQFETPPYYIEAERWGLDLRAWTEKQGGLAGLTLETRLRLMGLAAEAVATVHSVGMLHKDLKPQNILVRGDAANFEVRLCDFGAGMMIDSSTLDDLKITRLGFTHTVARAGTPIYIAPEIQAGGTPSIQSDVYSLGVLLYQLVVGEWRPVAFGWEDDIPDELLREDIAVCIDRDPGVRPPSALLVAQRLGALKERREQRERVRETERRNRALAESLERARARRPWVLAAAGTLIVAVGISWYLMLQARRAADLAAENERVARSVADFLVNDIVRQSSPDYGGRVDVTLKTAMLNSVPKVSERLTGPVAAELNQSLAEILSSLSAPAEAAKLAHSAAEVYKGLYGAGDRRTLSARIDELSYRLLLEPGPTLIAELDAISPALAAIPETDPVAVKAAMVRAWLGVYVEGHSEDSLTSFARALERSAGHASNEVDQARLMYIRLLVVAARYDDARKEASRLMPSLEKNYGVNGRHTLELHRMLGRIFEAERASTHDFPAAEAEYQTAIRGLTALYGADSGEVDLVRMDLGDLFINTERWSEAEQLERSLLARFGERLGPDSFYTWRTRLSLLEVLNAMAVSKPDYVRQAVQEARKTINLAREKQPIRHHYGRLLLSASMSMYVANEDAEALRLLDELDRCCLKDAPDDLEKAYFEGMSSYSRGLLEVRRREFDRAKAHFIGAIDKLPLLFGQDHVIIRDIRAHLAHLEALERDPSQAPPADGYPIPRG